MILFKLSLLFIIIFILISKKINLSIVLASSFLFLHIIFQSSIKIIYTNFLLTADNLKMYYLSIIVCSIIFLGNIMEKQGKINSLINSIKIIFSDLRYLFLFFPAFIGLLPMPGGAMFTAPMLNKVGNELSMSNEKKVFFNYWFRHIWEYVWPLYPAFIIMRNILGVSFVDLINAFYIYTVIAIVSGIVMILFLVNKETHNIGNSNIKSSKFRELFSILRNIWPIILIIFSIFLINIKYTFSEVHFIIILFTLNIFMLLKSSWTLKEKKELFKKSYTFSIFFLIIFIFLFKDAVNIIKLPELLKIFVNQNNFSVNFLLFLIPFISGLITGITYGIVAIAFPICMPFFIDSNGSIDLIKVAFCYASGFSGVLLSPLHLCLVMTNIYFDANLKLVYYYLIFPVSVTIIYAFYTVS